MKKKSVLAALGSIAVMTTVATADVGAASARSAPASAEVIHRALLTALDDEYRAEAFYAAVLARHGEVRPFSNIVQAERRHAGLVSNELRRLGYAVPANTHLGKMTAPATLLAACEAGAEAERENISLYDKLIPTVGDAPARSTLQALQAASQQNHLPAFERCIARGGTPGRGPGGGMGGGPRWGNR